MRLAALALGALLAATASGAPDDQDRVTAIDDRGHMVALATPARRIVTLAPHATELALAAGARAQLVGVAVAPDSTEQLATLPRVASVGGIDRERLLALNPDLVIAWESGNRPGDLAWIAHQGIALYRSEPATLRDIATSMVAIGTLSGHAEHARQSAGRFLAALETAACRTSAPTAALYQLWQSPPMTLGGRHWLNEVFAHAGLVNRFGAVDRAAITLEPEAYLVARTGIVIDTQAFPALSRPGPQLSDGLAALCRYTARHGH